MKKTLSLIFVSLLVCLGFSACGGGGNTDSSSSLSSSDGGEEIVIPTGYVKESDSGQMFFEDEFARIYNYCSSIFYEDDSTAYAYYCSNKDDGNITDYIAFRKGVKINGEWYWSEKQLVLSPTENTWDSRHTCDPAVIKGEFLYNGENYNYLMTYLGCVTSNNMRNEVGLAVAKQPQGPWIKCDSINPIAKFPEEYNTWGYGQPSLVNIDKKGKVLLFYTAGLPTKTCSMVERWDFSNLSQPKLEARGEVPVKGWMYNDGSGTGFISNADFAYDSYSGNFYMIADSRPFTSPNQPSFVAEKSTVAYISGNLKDTTVGAVFGKTDAKWTKVFDIDYEKSGYHRNHNCCIMRDAYGWFDSSNGIEIAYTMSELDYPDLSLWTYRIYRYKYN